MEYKSSVDSFLDHILLSLTSEQAVVVLDGMWQNVLKLITDIVVYFDEHDPTSKALRRPDFSALKCVGISCAAISKDKKQITKLIKKICLLLSKSTTSFVFS